LEQNVVYKKKEV